MKRKISALAAVLLAIGLTACGNNNSQVSADATQNMQIESSVETENTNNTEEAEQTVTSEDASLSYISPQPEPLKELQKLLQV